jgi:ketosteroid isomerase-like protein
MKLILSLAFIMILTSVQAQVLPLKKIEEAVEQLRRGMVDPDATVLDKILHDDLSYGHSSGKIEDKSSFISALTDGSSDFVRIELKDQTIKVIDDIALVRHQLIADTKDKGKEPASIKIGILLVWKKQGEIWQLIARQAFKLPQ